MPVYGILLPYWAWVLGLAAVCIALALRRRGNAWSTPTTPRLIGYPTAAILLAVAVILLVVSHGSNKSGERTEQVQTTAQRPTPKQQPRPSSPVTTTARKPAVRQQPHKAVSRAKPKPKKRPKKVSSKPKAVRRPPKRPVHRPRTTTPVQPHPEVATTTVVAKNPPSKPVPKPPRPKPKQAKPRPKPKPVPVKPFIWVMVGITASGVDRPGVPVRLREYDGSRVVKLASVASFRLSKYYYQHLNDQLCEVVRPGTQAASSVCRQITRPRQLITFSNTQG